MEKLTLEHLAPYLPYKLNLYNKQGIIRTMYTFESNDKSINISDVDCLNYKPMLRPLSDLIKKIEIEGKEITPLFQICKKQGFSMGASSEWEYSFNEKYNKTAMMKSDNWIFRYIDNDKCFWVNGTGNWTKKHQKSYKQLEMFNLLFKWHFDVFRLIEKGLAIDINTLKQD